MKSRLIIGGVIILIGVSMFLDQIGFGNLFSTFWPMFIVLLGLGILVGGNYRAGLFFVGIGALLQTSELFGWNFFAVFWPVVIIFVGLMILFDRGGKNRWIDEKNTNSDHIDINAVFSGINTRITSKAFRGGKVNAIFGGAEVDLRNVTLADAGATLEVNAIFGGTKIFVDTSKYNVETQGTPVLGGWEDNFSYQEKSGKTLRIVGIAAFGGVEIVN